MNITSCSTFPAEFEDQMAALFPKEQREFLRITAIVRRSDRAAIGVRIDPSFALYEKRHGHSKVMIRGKAEPHIDVDAVKEAGAKWAAYAKKCYDRWNSQQPKENL